MTALAALDRASSGQMRFQSLGLKSQRMTSPSVPASIAAQCSTGTGRVPDRICDSSEAGMPALEDSNDLRPRFASHHALSSFMGESLAMQNAERKHCVDGGLSSVQLCFPRPAHHAGMHIGKRIKELMRQRGVSTQAMAQHCGVTPGAVSNWFSTGRISKTNLVKACALLHVEVGDVIAGDVGERGEQAPAPQSRGDRWTATARRIAQMSGDLEMTPAQFVRLVDAMEASDKAESGDEQSAFVRQLLQLAAKQTQQ